MRTRFLWLTIFLAVILFGFESVKACSCAGGANPCSFYQAKGGVAFIGTVINVVDSNEKYGQPIKSKARKITIKVDEVFKGNLPNEIITSDDGFSCDNYPFKLGGTYLVYSGRILENTKNILPVGLCSGTVAVQVAQDAINFLRRLKNSETPSILYGKVQKVINAEQDYLQALEKTKVVLTKLYAIENGQYKTPSEKEKIIETLTDEKGEYKFENLNPGRYKITANLPNDLWIPESREFYAGGKPFCQNYYLFAYANGSISGNVINADGTPGRLKLNISPSSSSTRFYYGETQTDENGNFTFHGLPEGNYRIYVSLNSYSLDGARSYPFEGFPYSTYYFPKTFEYKEAKIINLGHTEKIQNINLKMPLVPIKKTISGIVVWEDGRSSNKGVIYYRLKNTGTSRLGYIYAKEDGTFSFQVFDGVDYEIYAENNSQESYGVSEWIELNKNNLNKLVVKPRK